MQGLRLIYHSIFPGSELMKCPLALPALVALFSLVAQTLGADDCKPGDLCVEILFAKDKDGIPTIN